MTVMLGIHRTPKAQAAENARMAIRALTVARNSKPMSAALALIAAALDDINKGGPHYQSNAREKLEGALTKIDQISLDDCTLIPHPAVLARSEVNNSLRYLYAHQ